MSSQRSAWMALSVFFFFSSRRRHTRSLCDWSSDCALPISATEPGTLGHNRDGTFTDVTERSGLGRGGWASAVAVGDYNNDGFDDLFVTYWGQNLLDRKYVVYGKSVDLGGRPII